MQRTSSLLCLLAFALLTSLSPAVTVLDNIGQFDAEAGLGHVGTFNISSYVDSQPGGAEKFATSFRTGSGSTMLQLDSISVLFGTAGDINASSDPLVVSIYSNSTVAGQSYFSNTSLSVSLADATSAPHPNTLLGTLSAHTTGAARPSAPGDAPGGVAAFQWDATGLTLAADTTYWIVLSSTDSTGYYVPVFNNSGADSPGAFSTNDGWSVATGTTFGDAGVYTATGNVDTGNVVGVDVPANKWMTFPNAPLFFSINASVIGAPEPSKTLLGLLGCAGVMARRRRKRAL